MQLCLDKSDIPAHLLKYFKPKHVLKQKDDAGIPWRVAFALQADGWWLRSDIIWKKGNSMPESVTDRPTKAHEYIFLLTKSERYYYDNEAIKVSNFCVCTLHCHQITQCCFVLESSNFWSSSSIYFVEAFTAIHEWSKNPSS